jgi:hypothetical protein
MSVTSGPVRLKNIAKWLRADRGKKGLDALPLHQLERAREINRRLGERLRAGRGARQVNAGNGGAA